MVCAGRIGVICVFYSGASSSCQVFEWRFGAVSRENRFQSGIRAEIRAEGRPRSNSIVFFFMLFVHLMHAFIDLFFFTMEDQNA